MNINNYIAEKLKEFMENEARSCSMDFGCVTPEYVYRMWGGQVALEEIESAMANGGEGLMVQEFKGKMLEV